MNEFREFIAMECFHVELSYLCMFPHIKYLYMRNKNSSDGSVSSFPLFPCFYNVMVYAAQNQHNLQSLFNEKIDFCPLIGNENRFFMKIIN